MSLILIAGTDTEIGKTVITAGLVSWLNSNGIKTLGMKPFACGAILEPLCEPLVHPGGGPIGGRGEIDGSVNQLVVEHP